jgi:hypothetical protein
MTTVVLEGKEYLLNVNQAEKLGLLKKKDSKVTSWNEYVKKYLGTHGYSYNMNANMITHSDTPIYTADQLTQHEAKALAAFSQLIKLRRDWIGEWEPDWEDIDASYGVIWLNKNKLQANAACTPARSLSFPTEKMAKEFLDTFRDLIEEAKTLI